MPDDAVSWDAQWDAQWDTPPNDAPVTADDLRALARQALALADVLDGIPSRELVWPRTFRSFLSLARDMAVVMHAQADLLSRLCTDYGDALPPVGSNNDEDLIDNVGLNALEAVESASLIREYFERLNALLFGSSSVRQLALRRRIVPIAEALRDEWEWHDGAWTPQPRLPDPHLSDEEVRRIEDIAELGARAQAQLEAQFAADADDEA